MNDQLLRKCSVCQKYLSLDHFHIKKKATGLRQSQCRDCMSTTNKMWYNRNVTEHKTRSKRLRLERADQNIRFIIEYFKTHPCTHCGESNPLKLEFDHLQDKEANVSNLVHKRTLEKVKIEIAKCQVLCANCHRVKTAKERNFRMWQIIDSQA